MTPVPFTGQDRSATSTFLSEMDTLFRVNDSHFESYNSPRKVLILRASLTDDAARWFDKLYSTGSAVLSSWPSFLAAFVSAWDEVETPYSIYARLHALRQTGPVSGYNVSFQSLTRRLAAVQSAPIPDVMLTSMYVLGLTPPIRNALDVIHLIRYPGTLTWPSFADTEAAALDVDTHMPSFATAAYPRLLEAHTVTDDPRSPTPFQTSLASVVPLASPADASSSMALDTSTPAPDWELIQKRRQVADDREHAGRCRYCGSYGHMVDDCDAVKRKEAYKLLMLQERA